MRRKSNIWKRGIAVVSSAAMVLGMLSATPKMQVQAASDSVQFEPLEIASSSLNGNAIWGLTEDASKCALDNYAYFYAEKDGRDKGGLPVDGILKMPGQGVEYHLAIGNDQATAYDGNDCIRLLQTPASDQSATMNLQTIGVYNKIYVLATAGGPGGANYAKFSVTLNYTDGSSSEKVYKLYDWYGSQNDPDVETYANILRQNQGESGFNGSLSGGPMLQSATIDVDSTRLLKSVKFNMLGLNEGDFNSSSPIYSCIFAVSGATPQGVTSAPVATKATDINKSVSGPCFTANWNAVTGANSYVLDVAKDRNFTNILDKYNNINVGRVTSYTVSGLTADTTYYYRVRALNDKGQSLSSNRVATGVPDWAAVAGITDNDAEYDAENGILTVKNSVNLKDTITIPSGEKTIIQLENNCEVKAPDEKSAIKGSGKNVELKVTGDGKIIGGDGANGAEGAPAIDLSGVTGAGQVEITGNANIIGGNGADASGENQNGGAGGAAIKGNSSTTVSVGSSSESGSAAIIGGNGGAGKGTGNGGAGGTGIENSPVKITTGNQLSGGNGGDAENGNGGNGGAGVSGQTTKPSVPEGTTSGGNGGKSDKGEEYGGTGGSSGATGGTDGTKGHEHIFAAEWSTDKNSHWHACTVCGKKSDEAVHTESGWIIDKPATKLEEGKKHKECTVCKYVMEEGTIPKITKTEDDYLILAKQTVEDVVRGLSATNDMTQESLESSVKEAFRMADIPESVTVAVEEFVNTPATTDEVGKVTATITITNGDKTVSVPVNKVIPVQGKTDAQKAAEVKTKLEEALKQITWGNKTSLDEIRKELQKTAYADGATVDTTGLTITHATSKSNGSVTGSIKVTVGTQTVEIPVEQVIPKLNKTPEEKVAEAKTEAKEFLPNLTVSNDSTEESILKDLQDQLQKSGLSDVTVTIESFEQKPATTDKVGCISGTVTVENGGKKESFSFEKLISKLPKDDTQKTAKAKNIIVSQLDDSIIKNSTTPEELQQKLKEELKKSGMSDVELTAGDLQKTPATKEKDGTVTGTITVRCGDQVIQIPVSEKIPYEMTPEENAQMAQKVVEEKVKTITANNATTNDAIIEELQKELEKAGVRGTQLEWKQFNKTNATTEKAGSVSGTVSVIVGEKAYEIPVKMEISKLAKSDSETVNDAEKLVQDICNSKNADGFQAVNSTTKETLQEVLKEQLKDLDVDVSVIKLETKLATSEKEGIITATVQITRGNTKSEFQMTLPIQKVKKGGNFTVEGTEKKADAPKTELDSSAVDIKKVIPNAEEDNNKYVNVYLKVEQQPKEPEKKEQQKIQEVAEKEGITVDQYVDVSLFKSVTTTENGKTEEITKLSELNGKVKISMVVPENLRTTDKNVTRTYMLIRYHDGEAEAELVEGEYDAATYTFTFWTDKFSTYAIAYKDTIKNESGTSSGETEIPAKTNQEILALAKTSAQQTLTQEKVTNATTKEEIAQAVEKALAAENNTKNVSAEVLSFTKVASTTEKEGSISGTIKLTINGVTEEVPFSYTIAKLPKENSANSKKESFPYMIATASSAKVGDKQVGMSWKKVKGADGYEVYASTCDGKNNFKRVADTKKLSYTHKKLSNSKAYKYYIRAYKLVNGKKVYLKKTVTIHVALKEQKYTNAKAVTLSKKSYALKAGQKAQIKAKTVKENAKKKLLTHTAEFRYCTDNNEIAVVSKNGKITAKKAGTCTIYVMANNGVYNTVKVTVK